MENKRTTKLENIILGKTERNDKIGCKSHFDKERQLLFRVKFETKNNLRITYSRVYFYIL